MHKQLRDNLQFTDLIGESAMVKSIYTPLSGALAQERALEIVANNLANVNTSGFKAEKITFKKLISEPEKNYTSPLPPANYKISLEDIMPLRGNEVDYVGIDKVYTDMTKGPERVTNNPMDFMIDGQGFFKVHTHQGERLTRDGSFSLDTNGVLVNKDGHAVLGERGNIFLYGQDFKVNQNGEVYQDGRLIDRILVVDVADTTQLEKQGGNLYFYGGPEQDLSRIDIPTVIQGSIEGSNVNAIENLTQMIVAHRSYEAYTKALKNYDSMMEKSNNEIGRIQG
ncbi:MAG: flagellar basal-body rod protein FlgF [Oligoflexales bacterium]|nr:flagellar basal-body rod protein FlgF [Oligoflexales bacterium]